MDTKQISLDRYICYIICIICPCISNIIQHIYPGACLGYLKHLVFKPEHPDVISRSGRATVRVKRILGTLFPVGIWRFPNMGGTPIAGWFIS